jgi:hypothetical protein
LTYAAAAGWFFTREDLHCAVHDMHEIGFRNSRERCNQRVESGMSRRQDEWEDFTAVSIVLVRIPTFTVIEYILRMINEIWNYGI